MQVALQTNSGANYFNVLPPGSDAAIAIGSSLGNKWSGILPIDGDYSVRVYLMRSAARRNETANYTLSVSIIGSADAKVAQTPYNAVGTVPCSVGTDPKGSAQCSFCVIRSAPGQADVHLASPGYDFLRNVSSASPVPAAATPQSLSKSPVAVPVQSSSAWESPSAPTPAKQTATPNFAQPKKTIYT